MNNKLKKIISRILISFVLFFLFNTSYALAADFSDVDISHKNHDAIAALTEIGALAGYEDGTFMPEREITRTEFCAVLSRTMGYKKDGYEKKSVPFTDVADDYWGIDFISFCYERNMINGVGEGRFAPAAKVTYEQILKMLVCAIGEEKSATQNPGDKWYSGYVYAARRNSLMRGVDVEFGENAPRAAVAQMVYNALDSGKLPVESFDDNFGDTGDSSEDKETGSNDESTEAEAENNNGSSSGGSSGSGAGGSSGTVNEMTDEEKAAYQKYLDELKEYYAGLNPREVKTVLVDAGHNYDGRDRGAENVKLGIHEEDITFAIADELRKSLEENGFNVIMTRETRESSIGNTSEKSSLQARVDLGHQHRADLFISIHCNMGGGKGAETYCFSPKSQAAEFAELVQKNIAEKAGLYNRGVKNAGFYVIKNTIMPAVLIETGFMDNESDIAFLSSRDGQKRIASAIAAAVVEYTLGAEEYEAEMLEAQTVEELTEIDESGLEALNEEEMLSEDFEGAGTDFGEATDEETENGVDITVVEID